MHPSALRSRGSSVHDMRPELGFLLPVGHLSRICSAQSFLKGGSPCSELVLAAALSRFCWLRAELGSEAQDRLKVQGQQLAGRRLESEEDVQEERCQPCNSLLAVEVGCSGWRVELGSELP